MHIVLYIHIYLKNNVYVTITLDLCKSDFVLTCVTCKKKGMHHMTHKIVDLSLWDALNLHETSLLAQVRLHSQSGNHHLSSVEGGVEKRSGSWWFQPTGNKLVKLDTLPKKLHPLNLRRFAREKKAIPIISTIGFLSCFRCYVNGTDWASIPRWFQSPTDHQTIWTQEGVSCRSGGDVDTP